MIKVYQSAVLALNDQFRRGNSELGLWSITPKVAALPQERKQAVIEAVQCVDAFIENKAVSVSQEHDFGVVTENDTDYLWEIDYYDKHLKTKSTNPADPECTTRVLTLMQADEY